MLLISQAPEAMSTNISVKYWAKRKTLPANPSVCFSNCYESKGSNKILKVCLLHSAWVFFWTFTKFSPPVQREKISFWKCLKWFVAFSFCSGMERVKWPVPLKLSQIFRHLLESTSENYLYVGRKSNKNGIMESSACAIQLVLYVEQSANIFHIKRAK